MSLKLKRHEGDSNYLYMLERSWLEASEIERTSIGNENYEITLLLEDSYGNDIHLSFPDLSGETFQRIYDNRKIAPKIYEQITASDAIALFIKIDNINEPDLISELSGEFRQETNTPKDERIPSNDDSTQIQIIDLLQVISCIRQKNVKLGIILSAWDLQMKLNSPKSPETFLQERLNMLWQYLESNKELYDVSVWGVSALGSPIEECNKYLDLDCQVERIKVINTVGQSSNDITSIIFNILGDINNE